MEIKPDKRFAHEQILEFQPGEVIFAEGDTGRELYVIQEGQVVIRKTTPLGDLDLVNFQKGDFFGDMALLQGIPRYAGAVAVTKCRLLVLQPGGFLLKIRRDPTFAFEMIQQLSLRVKLSVESLMGGLAGSGISRETAQQIIDHIQAQGRTL